MGGATLPAEVGGGNLDFGTENAAAFLSFLEGYDALQYIQQANGRVATEFSPKPAMDSLIFAAKDDPDFLAPYETLIQFCRLCSQFLIGTFEWVEEALLELRGLLPMILRPFLPWVRHTRALTTRPRLRNSMKRRSRLSPMRRHCIHGWV